MGVLVLGSGAPYIQRIHWRKEEQRPLFFCSLMEQDSILLLQTERESWRRNTAVSVTLVRGLRPEFGCMVASCALRVIFMIRQFLTGP